MLVLGLAAALASEVSLEIEPVSTTVTQTTKSRLRQTLGRALDFYEHGLGVTFPAEIAVTVTIYGDRDAYREVAKAAGLPSWADGYFKTVPGKPPEAVLWAQDDTQKMMRVFQHEGSHFLLGYAGRTPRWLNEGLAQCFEHSAMSGNSLSIRPPAAYLEYLGREGAPKAEAVILDRSNWNELPPDEVGPLYIDGWALTAFLMSSANGQETLAAIVRAYKASGTAKSGLEAIDATYRGGTSGLQRDLERWVANPPSSVSVPRYANVEPSADALWTTCPDGRLVSTAIGCTGP
ncbi:MAG: hypothetical protein R3F61_31545 [Myxococcota bacterium]